MTRPGQAAPDRPGETEAERDDRNLIELLQELRVAGLGIRLGPLRENAILVAD